MEHFERSGEGYSCSVLEAKRQEAIKYLGRKWLMHPHSTFDYDYEPRFFKQYYSDKEYAKAE